ncbi:hypothetical protein D3C83_93760 [compost metagenome]
MIDFAFAWWIPQGRMISSSSSGFAAANAFGLGYFWKSPGVTRLTVTSVDCPARMAPTSSSHGDFQVSA